MFAMNNVTPVIKVSQGEKKSQLKHTAAISSIITPQIEPKGKSNNAKAALSPNTVVPTVLCMDKDTFVKATAEHVARPVADNRKHLPVEYRPKASPMNPVSLPHALGQPFAGGLGGLGRSQTGTAKSRSPSPVAPWKTAPRNIAFRNFVADEDFPEIGAACTVPSKRFHQQVSEKVGPSARTNIFRPTPKKVFLNTTDATSCLPEESKVIIDASNGWTEVQGPKKAHKQKTAPVPEQPKNRFAAPMHTVKTTTKHPSNSTEGQNSNTQRVQPVAAPKKQIEPAAKLSKALNPIRPTLTAAQRKKQSKRDRQKAKNVREAEEAEVLEKAFADAQAIKIVTEKAQTPTLKKTLASFKRPKRTFFLVDLPVEPMPTIAPIAADTTTGSKGGMTIVSPSSNAEWITGLAESVENTASTPGFDQLGRESTTILPWIPGPARSLALTTLTMILKF
jgi:hypothetical protein